MTLPDKDHPVWKVLQTALSLIGLYLYLSHTHLAGARPDLDDAAGGAGALFGVNVVRQVLSR